MEVQLKVLVNERNSIKASLTRFKKFFEESRNIQKHELTVLKRRHEVCSSLYNKYVHAQERIEQIAPSYNHYTQLIVINLKMRIST